MVEGWHSARPAPGRTGRAESKPEAAMINRLLQAVQRILARLFESVTRHAPTLRHGRAVARGPRGAEGAARAHGANRLGTFSPADPGGRPRTLFACRHFYAAHCCQWTTAQTGGGCHVELSISDIKVGKRFRKDLGDIDAATSCPPRS
jgi:hypothetical protein